MCEQASAIAKVHNFQFCTIAKCGYRTVAENPVAATRYWNLYSSMHLRQAALSRKHGGIGPITQLQVLQNQAHEAPTRALKGSGGMPQSPSETLGFEAF